MATLAAKGLVIDLPAGFEGRIFQRDPVGAAVTEAVVHLANFKVPESAADFGGGVTPLMGPDHVFVVLFEYGQESVGRALFAHQGLPREIPVNRYSPYGLKRGIAGQAGTQWFFTEAGRPFTLYVVLGSYARRNALAPKVHALLRGVTVQAKPLVRVP